MSSNLDNLTIHRREFFRDKINPITIARVRAVAIMHHRLHTLLP